MKRTLTLTVAATFLLGVTPFAIAQDVAVVHETGGSQVDRPESASRVVEIAICLDTSGSMDGLINAARQKLWSVVNDLATARPTPTLRVALLTYGNDGHAQENGWVMVNAELTEDLDKISEMLFALTTNGGTELVGRVIQSSIEELEWTPSEDALKMIIVAGNESADQDTEVPFRDMCKKAIEMGVMVNSIYCRYHGDDATIPSGWEEVARLADGQYATIDQNNTAVVIATPLDDSLIELSTLLNATYIPFGTGGQAGWANQQAQDDNALTINKAAAASRAQTKGSGIYGCSWDLVDACFMYEQNIEEVPEEDLPDNLRAMTMDERKAYVADMKAKREALQKKINDLNAERQQYVIAEQKRQAERGVDQFDLIIQTAVRDQARAKGFEIIEAAPPGEANFAALPYFVQYGDLWVAASFIDEYEQTRRLHRVPAADAKLQEGTPEYDAFATQLDEKVRAALESIEGATAVMKVQEKVYEVTMNAPAPAEEGAPTVNAAQVGALQTAQTLQQVAVPAQQMRIRPAPVQQQRQQQPDAASPSFVKRGDVWVDAAYVQEYDALTAQNATPTFDETVPNTPEGRESLLARLAEDHRDEAGRIFEHVLENFGGGMIVRIQGKLVFLPFDC